VAQKRQRSKQRQAERRAQRLAERGGDGNASARPSNDDTRELEEEVDLEVGAPPQDLGAPEFTTRHEEPPAPDFEVDDEELFDDAKPEPAARGPRGVRGGRDRAAVGPGEPIPKERGRLLEFLKAVVAELRRVQWPDRKTLTQLTGVVLFFVLIVGAYLGALDAIFSQLINSIL
jgi:preprotein translocase subunit SecE